MEGCRLIAQALTWKWSHINYLAIPKLLKESVSLLSKPY